MPRRHANPDRLQLDEASYQLLADGLPVRLERQPMELLLLLAKRKGELVTRNEIEERLWGTDVHVDTDPSINRIVRRLRMALSDDSDKPRFLETVVGKGYRLIGPIEVLNAKSGAHETVPRYGVTSSPATTERKPERGIAIIVSTVVGLAAVSGLLFGILRPRLLQPAAPATIRSVAVLPLANLANDPEQEYFAEGMTEELTTELAQISALKVISHTSVVRYKKTTKSLPQIAKELGVDAVIEGAVERSGDKVGINVQLIDAGSDRHLWAKSYERDLSDVLALQREVTNAIVNEIEPKLVSPVASRVEGTKPVDARAYESYLRGRFALERGELKKSVAYFEIALRDNPNFALAYAGLANSYISMGQPWFSESDVRPVEVLPKAKEAARKALEIDDSMADAHLAMARVIQLYEWDWPAVEAEYKKALERNQNDALAHTDFGEYLQEMGRYDEALAEFRRVAVLDPLSSGPINNIGFVHYTGRHNEEAIAAFQEARRLDPNLADTHVGLGWVYEQKRMYREAIAELKTAAELSGRNQMGLASLGQVLAESGRLQDAQELLDELKSRSKHQYISPCLMALVQVGLGRRDDAIASLEKGYANRDQWMLYLKTDPHFDQLRTDPRFTSLLRRVGFPN